MAKRRSDGEGSLFYSEAEDTWVAEVSLPDGRRQKKRNKDKQVVVDWLLEKRKALKDNRSLPDEKITVGAFLDRFLDDVAAHTLKQKTLSDYRWIVEKHVKPSIGRIKLASLKPHHLQSLYSDKLGEDLSRRTVQYIHSVIRRALNEAVKWELIIRNPADSVTAPSPKKKIPQVWTVDQAQTFLRAVEDHRFYPIYVIALTTGARRSEILGLEWDNINWERGTVSIRKTVTEVKGRVVVGDGKTKNSRRTIKLSQFTLDTLKDFQQVTRATSGFIFLTSNNTPIHPRNLLRHYYSVLDELDLPRIRFHDLRHTAATILLKQDVHPKKVQELLGHSSIVQTLDTYSHVVSGMHDEVADKMDEVFN